jgi:putative FmdB family regulatory protein
MPQYDWLCEKCDLEFETIERISEYSGHKSCTQCGNHCIRLFSKVRIHLTGTAVEDAQFNVGLGKVTKSKAHREELAKQLGVVEIGNDFQKPESVHKHFDSAREEKLKKAWDEV